VRDKEALNAILHLIFNSDNSNEEYLELNPIFQSTWKWKFLTNVLEVINEEDVAKLVDIAK